MRSHQAGWPVAPTPAVRPQPAGAVPLLTHDAAGGRWAPAGYPGDGIGSEPDVAPRGPEVPRGPQPGGRPPGVGAAHPASGAGVALAERPRRRSGPGGPGGPGGPRTPGPAEAGGRRRRRRVVIALAAAFGLLVLAPVVAFLVGWMIFTVPTADQTAVTQVATFKYADGTALATIRPDNVNRTIVPIDQVPDDVKHAVLSAEDRSFYSNPGFDITGIGRALWNQLTGGVGGGSTITQQYIKVSTGQDAFSLSRKYKEVILAVKISQEQTKDQILGNYLNVIYFGRSAYGIQAASQAYFGKDVQDLKDDPAAAAMLAAAIQSPSRWDTADDRAKGLGRWNFVLDGMVAQGWLQASERPDPVKGFPAVKDKQPQTGIPGDESGHIYNLAKAELEARGISEQEINTEGVTVDLTIDSKRQQQAVDTVTRVMKGQPGNLRSALVSVDPRTGAILAYYGGDNGVGTDYAQAMRQPGSSFKPFVLAAALQNNVLDPNKQPVGLGSQYDGSSPQTFIGIPVSNSEGFSCNPCDVHTAMTKSVNTVFYRMGIDTGPARVVDMAHRAGIPADELPNPTAGIALGDKEVRPLDMAAAFATFAADGIHHDAYLVTKVTAADGRVLYDHGRATGEQAIPQPVARNVTEAMKDVPASSLIALAGGRDEAGKTGTVQHPTLNNQNKDAWMVGFTPSVSTAVWVGTDASDPIKNAQGRPVYGRTLPGSIWQGYMNAAARATPAAADQFSPFVAVGTPPSAAPVDPSADPSSGDNGDNKSGDNNSDGDSKKKKDHKDKHHGDSNSSDGSGDSGSADGSSGGDNQDSGGSGSDPSNGNAAFEQPALPVPAVPGGGSPFTRVAQDRPLSGPAQ